MKTLILTLICLIALPAGAWRGYDADTDDYIEIEKGTRVRKGSIIEIYDHDAGEYIEVEVQEVNDNMIEVYDLNLGDYRTFEMD